MTIWEFLYNSCVWESSYATISMHLSKEGAEKALAWHKEEKRKEWAQIWSTPEDQKNFPFGQHEDWAIRETEVLP